MIKLVAFDLWGTLIHEGRGYSSVNRILEMLRIEIPKEKFRKIFQQTVETRRWESKHEAFSKLCHAIGIESTESNIDIIKKIRDNVKNVTRMYPHTTSMLQQLKNQGLKIGIISNSDNFTIQHIKNRLELFEYVDYHVFSFEIGTVKPDPRMFKEMLKVSGYRPAETIMIGDKLDDDILPATQTGMGAIHFQDYEQLKKDLKVFSIPLY